MDFFVFSPFNSEEEAWKLFRLMEDDEHLPSPNVATYTILLPAVAKHEGPQEALRILSRHRALGIALEPISCLMMGVIFAALPSPNLGIWAKLERHTGLNVTSPFLNFEQGGRELLVRGGTAWCVCTSKKRMVCVGVSS